MHPPEGSTYSPAHPTAAELTAFGLGRLDLAAALAVARHVAACEACCRRLEAVPPDELLTLLRAAPIPAEPAPTPAAAASVQAPKPVPAARRPGCGLWGAAILAVLAALLSRS